MPCLRKIIRGVADVVLDDVVPEDHADGFAVGEKFGQPQSLGDSALAFLVRVVHVLQAEILAVAQQPQEFAGVFPARHHQNVLDARIHQRLNGVIDHRLVIDGEQMLVRDLGERIQATAQAPCENDALHKCLLRSRVIPDVSKRAGIVRELNCPRVLTPEPTSARFVTVVAQNRKNQVQLYQIDNK